MHHFSLNAVARVGLELDAALGIEALQRFEQTDDTGMDQRFEIDTRRQSPVNFFRHEADQRQILRHRFHLLPDPTCGPPPEPRWKFFFGGFHYVFFSASSKRRKKNCTLPFTLMRCAESTNWSAKAKNARLDGASAAMLTTVRA